ncbi:MAG: hypothetical protein NTV63_00540 [Candidatus Woesearchaeota archaeon]|nr:hypothetical protein [Candidatus Woesearchaeota archaeon]
MRAKNLFFYPMLLISILILIPNASAAHMKLLAVAEAEGGYEGSVADLYLSINSGLGRVFVETFPIMKVDTQISTRFAKEIACQEAGAACSAMDFFYTIKANSAMIGGPSASAAIAALTYAELKNLKIDETVSVTGTINSGGLVGAVGGVKEKIEAAAKAGIKKVLIPEGENLVFSENDSESMGGANLTNISIYDYAKSLGIEAVEVSNIREVIYYTTGHRIKEFSGEIKIDEEYTKIMKGIANELCDRSELLASEIIKNPLSKEMENNLSEYYHEALNLTERYKNEMIYGNFYSAASYCFGANVKLGFVERKIHNMSISEIITYSENIKSQIKDSRELLIRNYDTITGLQSYVIVDSRISEAEEYADEAMKSIAENKSADAIYSLSYAEERLVSANLWKRFFEMPGKKFNFNEENMRNLCLNKISEAEERHQYAEIFIKVPLTASGNRINEAIADSKNGEYEACFEKAGRAKAESDVVLSLYGITDSDVNNLLEKRLEATKQIIMKQGAAGMFPIAGFSYYEYANSLKENDLSSAYLYSGYALEMSGIDIYFNNDSWLRTAYARYRAIIGMAMIFISGVAFGAVGIIYLAKRNSEKTKTVIIKNKKNNKSKSVKNNRNPARKIIKR